MTVASLAMYPFDHLRPSWDQLWEGVRSRLSFGAPPLDWDLDPDVAVRRDDLVLGQTCGWPLATAISSDVHVVGTFDCDVDGDADGSYRSVIVSPIDASLHDIFQRADLRVAVNSADSLSGWISLRSVAAAHDVAIDNVEWTGAHANSVVALQASRCPIASIDAVSWAHLEPRGLFIVGHGPRIPCLPLVTARSSGTRCTRRAAQLPRRRGRRRVTRRSLRDVEDPSVHRARSGGLRGCHPTGGTNVNRRGAPPDLQRKRELLDSVVVYLADHGLADTTLRPMAADTRRQHQPFDAPLRFEGRTDHCRPGAGDRSADRGTAQVAETVAEAHAGRAVPPLVEMAVVVPSQSCTGSSQLRGGDVGDRASPGSPAMCAPTRSACGGTTSSTGWCPKASSPSAPRWRPR